jgi:hypothetical protein
MMAKFVLTEVLQSKLHSSSQGETLALRLFHKPSKINALNVFVFDCGHGFTLCTTDFAKLQS